MTDDDLTLIIRMDWQWQSRQSDIMFHRMCLHRMLIVSVTWGFGSSPQDIRKVEFSVHGSESVVDLLRLRPCFQIFA